MPGNLQGFTPADLARLRSVQTSQGRTAPRVVERRVGLRMVRLIREVTDSGATITTREYHARRSDHVDVHVHAPLIRGALFRKAEA
ncbi:hypothetical protein [Streptosporangium sp. NPDC087985]|uniref:hypothetical protein n=1 Tax=Streptosporangium sp. NPDC087985 TaxID=3366196 RepID=UPI00382B8A2F